MAEIQVVFPPPSNGSINPVVRNHSQHAWTEDVIVWNVYSEDPDVQWVKIWFEDSNALYFPVKQANGTIECQNWFKKKLVKDPSHHENHEAKAWKIEVWGRVNEGAEMPDHREYTVAGYSEEPLDGAPLKGASEKFRVSLLDPEIVPIRP